MVKPIAEHLPDLREAQLRGLAAWVSGTMLAKSACESSVIRELLPEGGTLEGWRARPREFLCDGKEKAAPCATQVEVEACFPALLRWLVESGAVGAVQQRGWHPISRIRADATCQPQGGKRLSARALVSSPGRAWVGKSEAFKHAPVRQAATLIVIWAHGQKDPWVLLPDLAPKEVGVSW